MKTKSIVRTRILTGSIISLLVGGSVFTQLAGSVHAASAAWNVDTASTWTTGSNWSPTAAPGSTTTDNTDVATFSKTLTAARTVTVDTNRYIGGISFGNTSAFGYTLSGGILHLNSGGVIQTLAADGAHTETISSALVISGTSAATATFTSGATTTASGVLSISGGVTGSATSGNTTSLTLNGTGTGANTVSGIIGDGSGGGKLALIKGGAGFWSLSGTNTFTGALSVQAGTLQITGSGSLGSGSYAGAITDTGTLQYSSSAAQTLSGGISGTAGALIKDTSGSTLTLTNTNTYTGATTVNAGTLDLGGGTSTGSLTSSVLNLGGGTFAYTRTGSTTQTFTTTNLTVGVSAVSAVTGNILNLGTIVSAGGTIDLSSTGAGTVAALMGSNVNGIIPGATFGSTWAVATGASSAITGYSGYTLTSTAGTTAGNYTNTNIDVDNSAGTMSGVITPESFRFNTAAANVVTLATGANIVSGGILVTSAVGNNLSTITGGTLEGAPSAGLAVIQNNTSNSLTIGSVIADNGGATGLTKSGAGTLTLTGVNTFSGATAIGGGTLQIGGAGQLNSGTYANAITLSNGATLQYSSSAAQTLSGVISGSGALIKDTSSSTLTLSGANTYTGDTTVSSGTVIVANATGLGANNGSNITLNGGSLQITASGQVNLNKNLVITGTGNTISTVTPTTGLGILGTITGSGTVTLSPTSSTVITAGSDMSTFSGKIIVNASGQQGFSFVQTSSTATTAGSSLAAFQFNGGDRFYLMNSANTGAGTVYMGELSGTGGHIYAKYNRTGTVTMEVGALGTISTYSGIIGNLDPNGPANTGTTALTKVGSGTLTLAGASTYSSGTTVKAGTLVAGIGSTGSITNGPFGTAAVLLGDTANSNNASLLIGGAFTVGNAVTVQSGSTSNTITIGGSTAAASIFTGTMTLGTASSAGKNTTFLAQTGGSVDFQGVIKDATSASLPLAAVTVGDGTQTGTVKFSNTANTYGGTTTIASGATLQVAKLAAGGSNSSIGNSGSSASAGSVATDLIINGGTLKYTGTAASTTNRLFTIGTGGATLDASGTTLGTLSFTGTGSLAFSSSTAPASLTLTGTGTGATGAASLASIIGDSGMGTNITSLTKSGSGTWTLSGINTYSGGTNLNAGSVILSGSGTLGTGSALTMGGGQLDLGGASQTVGAVSITAPAASGNTIQNGSVTGTSYSASNTAGTATITANLLASGSAGFTMSGAGGTVALSGTNTYTGATSITAGTLSLTGSGSINSSSSPITINGSGATFSQANTTTAVSPTVTLTQGTLTGSGTVNTVNVGAGTGGIISNNNGVAGASLTIGGLTFNGAATVNTFSASTSAPIVTTTLATNVAGTVTINPTAASWTPGTYNLISYAGTYAGRGLGQFVLGTVTGLATRQSPLLGNSGTALTLAVIGDNPVWSGANGGIWQTAATNSMPSGTPNWALSSAHSPTDFWASDAAEFDDTVNIGGTTAAPSTTTVTIQGGNVSPASIKFNNSALNYTVTSSDGSGIAAGVLIKSGTGSVTLNTANTYTGGTTINQGTVIVGNATALGDNAGAVSVASGAVLDLNGIIMTGTNALTLNGTGISSGGALTNSSSTGGTYAGLVTLGSSGVQIGGIGTIALTNTGTLYGTSTGFNLTLGGAGGSVASIINGGTSSTAGAGGLTVNTTGTWTLSGANTYTGDTTISSGTVVVSNATGLGANNGSNITLSGGSLQIAASGQVNLNKNLVITGTGNTISTVSPTSGLGILGTITGSGTVTWSPTSSSIFTAGSDMSTFSGKIIVNASGQQGFSFVQTTSISTTSGSSLAAFQFNGGDRNYLLNNANAGAGTVYMGELSGTGGHIYAKYNRPGTVTMEVGALGTISTYSGVIGNLDPFGPANTGTTALTKVGSGSLTLAGANTYSSGTTVSAGSLVAGVSNVGTTSGAFGPSGNGVTLGDANTAANNSSPSLLIGGAFTVSNPITVANQATSGTYTIGGSTANSSTFSGAITLNQPLTVTQVASGTLNLTGNISSGVSGMQTLTFNNAGAISQSTGAIGGGTGTIAVTQMGAGTTTLSGANTYTGGTTVSAGTLQVANPTALGGNAGTVSVSTGAVLDLNGTTMTGTNALTLNGTGVSNGGALTNSSSTAVTYAGNVTLAGASSIGGTGTSGAVTLSGTLNLATHTLIVSDSGTVNLGGATPPAAPTTDGTLYTTAGTTNVNAAIGTGSSTVYANATTNFTVSQTLSALNIGVTGFTPNIVAPDFAGGLSAAAAPEPGSISLLLVGALGLGCRRRRVA